MRPPFEGILGNNCALRTIEFLLPLYGVEYNITELADQVKVSRQSMSRILKTFEEWGMLNTRMHGAATLYSINAKSPLVSSILLFNKMIIEKMFESEEVKGKYFGEIKEKIGIPENELIWPIEIKETNSSASGSWAYVGESLGYPAICEGVE